MDFKASPSLVRPLWHPREDCDQSRNRHPCFAFHALAKYRLRNRGRWLLCCWFSDIQSRQKRKPLPQDRERKACSWSTRSARHGAGQTILPGRCPGQSKSRLRPSLANESRGLATFDTVRLQGKVDHGGQLRLRSLLNFGFGHLR